MATLVLSAAGSALGGAVGGSLAGIGAGALGRAAGSVVGGLVDQQVFGRGSATVETGRVENFRVQSAIEGASVPKVYGRMRVGGQMIWSSDFLETVDEGRQGGKGGQKVKTYAYTVSFAIGLCEGRVSRIGRVWADGNELTLSDYTYRLHKGGLNQQPDPLIDALEDGAPGFRDLAYIVFENLPVGPFGNRIPQLNVEVFCEPRPAIPASDEVAPPLSDLVRGVALSPGSGEFSLETEPVERRLAPGRSFYENVNTLADCPDIIPALDQLEAEAPNCGAVSLVVSWFGDDLRCGQCAIQPCVETEDKLTEPYAWEVSGVGRGTARVVTQDADGRPVFGGTPSDRSVIRAIQELKSRGQRVMFYPFILMDIPSGNSLPNPWTGDAPQPAFPWRGRITLDRAPGVTGSADQTSAAASEVASYFGQAAASDFTQTTDGVGYVGPAEWSMRRFILHYAHLCAAAGGVDSFCIGSEMRGLTQIRSGQVDYPAVDAFMQLVADVRSILGPAVKLGYAADWSEYFGHQPSDGSGDTIFHLDPLWAHPDIDFVGIDNYLPLSDWRHEAGHLDQNSGAKSVYSLPYLSANIEGGEGYNWFYADAAARAAQNRSPIVDTAHGEDWLFRPKDISSWWSNPHHNRPGGVRDAAPTAWTPGSKPIWFTELGCPAVDLGANQPNVFVDPKSSESFLPYFSTGLRDDYMQQRYILAVLAYWGDEGNNPASGQYVGRMIDLDNVFLWTWDARPWPDFPLRSATWSDGDNHRIGHWLTGRLGAASLPDVVADICENAGLNNFDVSDLHGVVNGLNLANGETARERLQPLMMTHGFDAVESGGVVRFRHRQQNVAGELPADQALLTEEGGRSIEFTRMSEGELPRALRLSYIEADGAYETGAVEAQVAGTASTRTEGAAAPITLDTATARQICDRWLAEAHISRDGATMTTGRGALQFEVGDTISLDGKGLYRIDRVEELGRRELTLTRVESAVHVAIPKTPEIKPPKQATPATRLAYHLLDLPVYDGGDALHAVKIAAFSDPWTSAANLYLSRSGDDYELAATAQSPAIIGELATSLSAAGSDRFMRGTGCDVEVYGGGLSSADRLAVLNGANQAAVQSPSGDWEILQFSTAELVGSGLYRLGGLLRGQAGTDAFVAAMLPQGAPFVVLNGAVADTSFGSLLGRDLNCLIGPSHKPITHFSYQSFTDVAKSVGYRPYRPAHLRVRSLAGDIETKWIRRSRVDGDGWDGYETPLGEERELYLWQARVAGQVVREELISSASHLYAASDQAADGAGGDVEIAVSQISDRFGPGPAAKVTINV